MTAEIGILNRQGISLAADSAVTCGSGDKMKILNTANKLFNLIKGKPIGIMVYGSGDFMGLPWETVIGEYRKYTCSYNINFDTLEEYAENFISFLNENKNLYNQNFSENMLQNELYNVITEIATVATQKTNNTFQSRNVLPDESDKIFLDTLDEYLEYFRNLGFCEGFNLDDLEEIKTKSTDIVEGIKNRLVVKIDAKNTEKLQELIALILCKDCWGTYTGVVVAGYGDNDLLPKLEEFYVAGIINGKLKYRLNKSSKIYQEESHDKPIAEIIPFAQQEMIHSILSGIEPNLESFIFEKVSNSYNNIKSYVNYYYNKTDFVHKESAQSLEEGISFTANIKNGNDPFEDFLNNQIETIQNELQKTQLENFIMPILDMVSILRKEELAVMAETLVNITSFKRKFTFDDETVGGPIDVAVISKNDGFIWIKRKHYFNKDLNHTYFK